MLTKDQITEKLKDGWIQAGMSFEVLAITEEAAKDALKNHVDKIEKNEFVRMIRKEFSQTEKVENPIKGIGAGFSRFCETEVMIRNFDTLVQLVMEFGPSSVEIIKPDKYQLNIGEAQNVLNVMAEMMHRFAAAGLGGIVIARAGSHG